MSDANNNNRNLFFFNEKYFTPSLDTWNKQSGGAKCAWAELSDAAHAVRLFFAFLPDGHEQACIIGILFLLHPDTFLRNTQL